MNHLPSKKRSTVFVAICAWAGVVGLHAGASTMRAPLPNSGSETAGLPSAPGTGLDGAGVAIPQEVSELKVKRSDPLEMESGMRQLSQLQSQYRENVRLAPVHAVAGPAPRRAAPRAVRVVRVRRVVRKAPSVAPVKSAPILAE